MDPGTMTSPRYPTAAINNGTILVTASSPALMVSFSARPAWRRLTENEVLRDDRLRATGVELILTHFLLLTSMAQCSSCSALDLMKSSEAALPSLISSRTGPWRRLMWILDLI